MNLRITFRHGNGTETHYYRDGTKWIILESEPNTPARYVPDGSPLANTLDTLARMH